MNIEVTAQKIIIDNDTSHMVKAIINGDQVKIEQFSTAQDITKYCINFYQKWAYRTHKIENAVVTVTVGEWISE